MTPVASVVSAGIGRLQLMVVPEQFLNLVTALLQAAEGQAEGGHAVAHGVERLVAVAGAGAGASAGARADGDGEEQGTLVGPGGQAAPAQFLGERVPALFDLDEERLAGLGEAV